MSAVAAILAEGQLSAARANLVQAESSLKATNGHGELPLVNGAINLALAEAAGGRRTGR